MENLAEWGQKDPPKVQKPRTTQKIKKGETAIGRVFRHNFFWGTLEDMLQPTPKKTVGKKNLNEGTMTEQEKTRYTIELYKAMWFDIQ